MSSALSDLLASGAAVFGQGSRILKLRFAEGSGIPEDTLLPHRVQGEESLSKNYRYTLDCLSADANLELKELLGQPVELSLLLPDGGERLLTGLVTRAEHQGADGGFAKYTLTIEPALATLTHRRNSRAFQEKTVPEIVAAILDEHLAANPAFTQSFQHQAQLSQTYPSRSYCLQYRESDLAFIERLLAEEGISYFYTHGPNPATSIRDSDAANDGDAASADNATPLHTLILFDANHQLPENSQPSIRFHRTDGIESADSIDQWTGSRQIQAGATQLASYDYKAVSTHTGGEATRTQHGEAGNDLATSLEDYDPQAAYYGNDPDEIARYANLRQQSQDLASKTFQGEGTVRSLLPGTWFELTDHPTHDHDAQEDRQFLVTALTFEAENNLTPDAKQSLGGLLAPNTATGNDATGQNRPPYRNTFTVVRRAIPVVPEFSRTTHQKPTAGGLTTATVVGPAGEEIFTDEHGRIKIQFHWQRPADHPAGGADLDDHSSTWVRVAMPSAGAAWGSQYIPRIGQEVIIDFIEGDIDRPLVTGVVYNGSHRPPTFSGAGSLPANKTLSGTKSKEYKGSRYNELLFDDSTNEIRTKLSSEHGKTQLNQGFLIHPRTEGKGEARGEGFELRTDAAGAIRAAQSLILSAEPQKTAGGHQLAREALIQVLNAALALTDRLGDHAAEQQANQPESGRDNKRVENAADPGATVTEGHQTQLKEAIDNLERGSNTDLESKSGQGNQRGGQSIVAITGPHGVAMASQQSVTVAANTNVDMVAQRDINQTSARRWIHNAGESICLFVSGSSAKLKETFKLIAAKGKLLIQAQDGEMEATAKLDIKITSVDGKIVLQAPTEILLMAGGGYIRIGANIEIHNPGSQSQKAGSFSLSGPASLNASATLPQGKLKECEWKNLDAIGKGDASVPIN